MRTRKRGLSPAEEAGNSGSWQTGSDDGADDDTSDLSDEEDAEAAPRGRGRGRRRGRAARSRGRGRGRTGRGSEAQDAGMEDAFAEAQ
jgi:hypothetical protein